MRVIAAFGINDLRNIWRESMLAYLVLVPWLVVVLVRLVVPALDVWAAETFNFDLAPYYPLILSVFMILQIPLMFGVISGLLMLDERDEGVLTALRVTPLSMAGYAAYRIIVALTLSAFYVLVCTPLSGLMPISLLISLAPISILAGLFAPLLALLLVAFAGNKVEGLALMKGFGILMMGPFAAYFVHSDWQLLLGLLPSYWPAKAFWVASAGETFWPYVVVGIVYQTILIAWLLRRFDRRLHAV